MEVDLSLELAGEILIRNQLILSIIISDVKINLKNIYSQIIKLKISVDNI